MRWRILLFPALCFSASVAGAADTSVETLLARMRAAYKAANTAQFTSVAELNLRNGRKATVTSTVNYAKGNKVHASVKGFPSAEKDKKVIVYTDGKTVKTLGFPGGPGEYKYSHQSIVNSLAVNLETLCFWDFERQLSTKTGANMNQSRLKVLENQKWDGKTWTVLEETAGQSFIRYFIDPKTALIHRTHVMNTESKRVFGDYRLKSLKLNSKVDPKLFIVVPTASARIAI